MARVAVFGSVTMEYTFTVSTWPMPGTSMDATTLERKLGGKGLYQAVACRRLNALTTLITSVGNDPYGKEVAAELAYNHITPCIEYEDFVPWQGMGTDVTMVVECGDESYIIARRDATDKLSLKFIEEQGHAVVDQSDAVLVTFDASLAAAGKLIELARAADKPVIVNASPPSD